MLVSLISRLVACSPRIVVDKQTDRRTDTQNDYCNPRCACAPRVNYTENVHMHTVVLICMSIILVIYNTSNQPIDSNIPLAIISNWLERMCNIIPLQQKPILATHSHVHTCLLLRSYKVIHSPHCAIVTVQTGKAVFLQSKFIQKHKNIYCCIDMLPIAL